MPQTHFEPATLPSTADARMFRPALDWWSRIASEKKRIPTRSELAPDYLTPTALPHTMLIDIADNGEKLRWRLMGTAHVAFNQRDLTGVEFDDHYPEGSPILSYVKCLYRELISTRRPLWSVNDLNHCRALQSLRIRRLMLPVSVNSVDIDLCVSVQTIDYPLASTPEKLNPWRHSLSIGEKERVTL